MPRQPFTLVRIIKVARNRASVDIKKAKKNRRVK